MSRTSESASKSSLRYLSVKIEDCIALRRNPQYLTEKQMLALRESVRREGFLAPIVLRPHKSISGKYEILSGNHRLLAAREENLQEIPAVLMTRCSDRQAARIAVNMNTVHGDPNAELIAPFLADLEDNVLREVFLPASLREEIINFDEILASRLQDLEVPDKLDSDSNGAAIPNCVCKCGNRHVAARKVSASSRRARATTRASKAS